MIIKIKFVNIFSRYFIEHKINRKYDKIKQGKFFCFHPMKIFFRFYVGKRPKTHKFNILGKTMGITFSINERSFGSLRQLRLNFWVGLVLVEVAILWKRMSIVLNFKIQLFWICMRLYQAYGILKITDKFIGKKSKKVIFLRLEKGFKKGLKKRL